MYNLRLLTYIPTLHEKIVHFNRAIWVPLWSISFLLNLLEDKHGAEAFRIGVLVKTQQRQLAVMRRHALLHFTRLRFQERKSPSK